MLESLSFRTAITEADKVRDDASFVQFIRHSRQPELPVILLEDLAALLGLVFALVAVCLSLVTGNYYFDVAGTAMIGLLLVAVAVVLALETKSLLLGESATPAAQARIVAAISGSPGVERIIHLKTLHLGPEELLVAAKIGVCTTSSAEEVATAIDEAERAIRAAEPTARVDLPRARHLPQRPPAGRATGGTAGAGALRLHLPHCRAIAMRSRSSGSMKWSWSSSPTSICTQWILPVNRLVAGGVVGRDGRAGLVADVGRLVGGEDHRLGRLDAAGADRRRRRSTSVTSPPLARPPPS